MATDSHGMGIELPADATPIHQFPGVTRNAMERVAEILAGDLPQGVVDAVNAAAGPAVDAELAAADVVVGTDGRVPVKKPIEGAGYLAVEVDTNYKLSRGTKADGTQHIPKLQTAHANSYNYPTDAYLKASIDANGRIAEDAIGPDGRVPAWILAEWAKRMAAAPAAQPTLARGIICRGDSITAGAFGNGTSYPTELNKLRPELAIAKRGYPGEQSWPISQRQGSSPLLVTVTGGIIPASGSVAVTLNVEKGNIWFGKWAEQGVPDGRGETGTINGIQGTLAGSPGSYTFTRTTAGDAYNTPDPVPFLSDWESVRRDWNQILMTGYNGGGANTIEATAKMVAWQTAGDFLVLSITTSSDDVAGTAGYAARVNTNLALKDAYPKNYFDLRGWLIANGLAAVGITPTAADNTAIAGDTLPPSLMAADKVHPNAAGYKAMAIGINQVITARGWK